MLDMNQYAEEIAALINAMEFVARMERELVAATLSNDIIADGYAAMLASARLRRARGKVAEAFAVLSEKMGRL